MNKFSSRKKSFFCSIYVSFMQRRWMMIAMKWQCRFLCTHTVSVGWMGSLMVCRQQAFTKFDVSEGEFRLCDSRVNNLKWAKKLCKLWQFISRRTSSGIVCTKVEFNLTRMNDLELTFFFFFDISEFPCEFCQFRFFAPLCFFKFILPISLSCVLRDERRRRSFEEFLLFSLARMVEEMKWNEI